MIKNWTKYKISIFFVILNDSVKNTRKQEAKYIKDEFDISIKNNDVDEYLQDTCILLNALSGKTIDSYINTTSDDNHRFDTSKICIFKSYKSFSNEYI